MPESLGRHWLLLRGLGRESAHWGEFANQLQDAFPNARITLLDLPGTGCYYRQASPNSITAIAESLRRDALSKRLLDQPVSLLGLSLGGMVVWEWMQRHPQEIAGGVLINTSFADLSPFYRRLHWQSYRDFAAVALTRDARQRETRIVRLVSHRSAAQARIIDEWQRIHEARPVSAANVLRQMFAAAAYSAGDRKPRRPVLLLSGQSDRLVSPACTEAIHDKFQLEWRRHPQAGHDLPLDDGEWVAAHIQDWVARIESADHPPA